MRGLIIDSLKLLDGNFSDERDWDGRRRAHHELLEWLRAAGANTRTLMAFGIIVEHSDGWYYHGPSKLQRNGHDYIVPGTSRVAADYTWSVRLGDGEAPWPSWLGVAEDLPDVDPAHVLELIHRAQEARHRFISGDVLRTDAELADARTN